jgi:hypothetical protein
VVDEPFSQRHRRAAALVLIAVVINVIAGQSSRPSAPPSEPALVELPSSEPSQAAPNPQTPQVELPFTGVNDPERVAVDSVGNVYVADYLSNRALKLPAGSTTQTELPFTGLTAPWGWRWIPPATSTWPTSTPTGCSNYRRSSASQGQRTQRGASG